MCWCSFPPTLPPKALRLEPQSVVDEPWSNRDTPTMAVLTRQSMGVTSQMVWVGHGGRFLPPRETRKRNNQECAPDHVGVENETSEFTRMTIRSTDNVPLAGAVHQNDSQNFTPSMPKIRVDSDSEIAWRLQLKHHCDAFF